MCTESEDDGEQDRRLLGDRSDGRGDPGQQVRPGRLTAQESEADGDRDQPDRDDEQDPDEPVELALKRRPPTLGAGKAPGDPARLCRLARRDDDRFAGPADDTGPRIGHGSRVQDRGAGGVRLDRAFFGHGFAGQTAPVEGDPRRRRQPGVRGNDVTDANKDDIARDELGGRHVVRFVGPAYPGHRGGRSAQLGERPVCAVFGDDVGADDRDEAGKNEQAVADLAQCNRADSGGDQKQHEWLREGLTNELQGRRRFARRQLVRPVLGSSPARLSVARRSVTASTVSWWAPARESPGTAVSPGSLGTPVSSSAPVARSTAR